MKIEKFEDILSVTKSVLSTKWKVNSDDISSIILLLISFTVLISCEKGSEDVIGPKIIWKTQLGPNPSDQLSQDPYIYQNKLIMGYQTASPNTEGYYIYDKYTGKVLKDIPNVPSFDPNSTGSGNLYISEVGTKLRMIDLNQYLVFEKRQIEPIRIFTNMVFENRHYLTLGQNPAPNHLKYEIIYADLERKLETTSLLKREMIFEEDVLGVVSSGLTVEIDNYQNNILYFGATKVFNKIGSPSKYIVEAFNMSTNQTVWKTDEFTIEGEDFGSIGWAAFDIYKNLYITGVGNNTLCAFNKLTGKIVWKTKLKLGGRSVIHNGKITVITNVGEMYLIDAYTGEILKQRNIGYVEISNISLHKGVMYFATVVNTLMAIDAETHKTKWNIPPSKKCNFCSFGHAYTIVDKETDRLYISDKQDVICYQLP